RRGGLLDHFQNLTLARLRPGCIEDRTHRHNGAAFFANDFADIFLGYPELDDDRVFPFNTPYLHFFWFLNNGLGNLLDQFLHERPLSTDSTIGLTTQPTRGDASKIGLPPLHPYCIWRYYLSRRVHIACVAPQIHTRKGRR